MRRSQSGYFVLQLPARQFITALYFFGGMFAFLISYTVYRQFFGTPYSVLAELPKQLIDLAAPAVSEDGDRAVSLQKNEALVRARLEVFADEFNRLKKYEAQIQKRVDSLNAMIDEIDRLDNGASEQWTEEPSRGRQKLGIGGADLSRAPHVIRGESRISFAARKTPEKGEEVALLLNDIDRKLGRLASVPMGSPVLAGINSGFGWRKSPFHRGGKFHAGVDFSVERNAPVLATADGIVTNAGYKGDYGIAVIVRHKDGIETLYGHLSKASVQLGERVCRGQKLGLVGNSGRSTGPHLHYEVRVNGTATNPMPYVELAAFAKMLQSEHTGSKESQDG